MHYAITGASSGIGEGLARYFGASADNKLTLVARRTTLLEKIASEVEAETLVCSVDLSDTARCAAWVDEAEEAFGTIDVLFNNAGIQYVEPALGVDAERAQRIINVNVVTPMVLTSRVAPAMVEAGRGAIVNVSSMAAITPTPGMAHYNASKSAIGAYSESLNVELKDTGVHIYTVYPGPVESPMESAARAKFEKSSVADAIPMGTPAELASLIDKGLSKKQKRLVYPKIYGVARHFRGTAQFLTDNFTPPVDESPG